MHGEPLPHENAGGARRTTHRVFLALWPQPDAAAALAGVGQTLARELGGRATARDRLHLTVAFVPAATETEIATLRLIGAAGASAVEPFGLAVDHLGTFRDSGVVWAASAVLPPAIVTLAANVRAALQERGLPVDRRPYRPHFTLVRRAAGLLRERTIAPIECAFGELTLIESELGHAGPHYAVLARWPLSRGQSFVT